MNRQQKVAEMGLFVGVDGFREQVCLCFDPSADLKHVSGVEAHPPHLRLWGLLVPAIHQPTR